MQYIDQAHRSAACRLRVGARRTLRGASECARRGGSLRQGTGELHRAEEWGISVEGSRVDCLCTGVTQQRSGARYTVAGRQQPHQQSTGSQGAFAWRGCPPYYQPLKQHERKENPRTSKRSLGTDNKQLTRRTPHHSDMHPETYSQACTTPDSMSHALTLQLSQSAAHRPHHDHRHRPWCRHPHRYRSRRCCLRRPSRRRG